MANHFFYHFIRTRDADAFTAWKKARRHFFFGKLIPEEELNNTLLLNRVSIEKNSELNGFEGYLRTRCINFYNSQKHGPPNYHPKLDWSRAVRGLSKTGFHANLCQNSFINLPEMWLKRKNECRSIKIWWSFLNIFEFMLTAKLQSLTIYSLFLKYESFKIECQQNSNNLICVCLLFLILKNLEFPRKNIWFQLHIRFSEFSYYPSRPGKWYILNELRHNILSYFFDGLNCG